MKRGIELRKLSDRLSLASRAIALFALAISAPLFTTPAFGQQQPLVLPCMSNGAPCRAPGGYSVGNLNLPLPFGITYNSMFSSRVNPSGARPSGFFGPGMTFPLGYIEVAGETLYRVAPDGTETAFNKINNIYVSENTPFGDLTSITCANATSCVETQPSGISIEFGEQLHGSRLYPTVAKDLDGHQLYNISYGTTSKLFTITDPNGFDTTFSASSTHPSQVGLITDPMGVTATITYDSNGRISQIQYDGATLSLGYDATGLLTRFTNSSGGDTVTWNYNYQGGILTDTIDSKNNSMAFSYSAKSVITINGAAGVPQGFTTTTYQTANARQIPVKYEVGKGAPSTATAVVWSSTLTPSGLPATSTDQLGRKTSYEYGTGPFPTSVRLPDGTVNSFTYDAANLYRATQIVSTGPDNKVITETLTWSGAKLIARSVNSDGAVVLNESYDSSSNSRKVTRTTTNTFSYDSAKNLVGTNGPGGRSAVTISRGMVTGSSINGVAFTTSNTVNPSDGSRTIVSTGPGVSSISTIDAGMLSSETSLGSSDGKVVITTSNTGSGTALRSQSSSDTTVVSGNLTTTNHSESTTTNSGSGRITSTGKRR